MGLLWAIIQETCTKTCYIYILCFNLEKLEELKNDLNHYKEYLELRKKIEDEYIESYFETRLKDLDVLKLIEIFKNKFGKDIILLCHEPIEEFCHRRLVADYIELKTGIYIPEIKQENNKIKELKPIRYKDRLEKYL
ncbi:MAG TPA: hypothetical protein PLV83_01000 [Bacilli bacterium]|nr:hypothetical protein [Bacilli bacterium]